MRKTTKIIIGIAVAVAVVGGGIAAFALRPQEDLSQSVLTETIERRTVTTTVAASGVIEPVSELSLSFSQVGTLATIDVEVGQAVSTGDVLATLDPADLEAAVLAAESAVASARSGVAQAAQVEAAAQQAINGADEALARAELSIAQAKDATTYRSEQRDAANRQKASAEASRDAAAAQMAAAQAQKSQAATSLSSARAQLEQAQRALAEASLVAPIDGTVISIASEVGEPLGAGAGATGSTAFIVLADLTEFVVTADFAEADVVGIEVGQEVSLSFDALPGQSITGEVLEVGLYGEVDPAGGRLTTYEVTISVPNPPAGLRVGMTSQASITTAEQSDVLAAPVTALVESEGKTYVQVLGEDGTITRVEVTVGIQGGYWVEITSGLSGGESVVTGSSGEIPVVGGGGFGGPPEGTPGSEE